MIENPDTGERIRILTSTEESGGRLLAFLLELPPGGRVPAPHRHPRQVERFTVLEGRLRLRAGRITHLLGPGQAASVGNGLPHGFSNPGPGIVRVRVEVRPALRMAELLETAAGLGARPGPVALARFLGEFSAEVGSPVLPRLVATVARGVAMLAAGFRPLGGRPAGESKTL